jgi:aminoglycoside phosphotransferase (APT) family kinase protein
MHTGVSIATLGPEREDGDNESDEPLDLTLLDVDEQLCRTLLAEQLPELSHLPLRMVGPWGTDNAMYAVGADLIMRLPRRGWAKDGVAKEVRWLPDLARRLPVPVPEPIAVASPSATFPWVWAVYRWLPGDRPEPAVLVVGHELAVAIGRFLAALGGIALSGGPPPGAHNGYRGGAIARRDRWVRPAIASERHSYDRALLSEIWDRALQLPGWERPPRWLHGDLTPNNLLVTGNGLAAVIDWGCLAVGDPACDLMIAWSFDEPHRSAMRAELDLDDVTWTRGRAAALWEWVGGLDDDDPHNEARRVIDRVAADYDAHG